VCTDADVLRVVRDELNFCTSDQQTQYIEQLGKEITEIVKNGSLQNQQRVLGPLLTKPFFVNDTGALSTFYTDENYADSRTLTASINSLTLPGVKQDWTLFELEQATGAGKSKLALLKSIHDQKYPIWWAMPFRGSKKCGPAKFLSIIKTLLSNFKPDQTCGQTVFEFNSLLVDLWLFAHYKVLSDFTSVGEFIARS
jgi:hypothetical protein